jgi:uncharacterized repeat protein (TIGR01451 family)
MPERFGVIDITPTNLATEWQQNSEPSLALGLNTKYGKSVVHAFTMGHLGNDYYTSQNRMGPEWTSPGTITAFDATLDWSAAGTCYLAIIPMLSQIQVLKSTDPTSIPFSPIAAATITRATGGYYPDQPWIRVVTVTNADHIFVGFNDLSVYPGRTAKVRYSLDNGTTWNETVIEKVTSGSGDGPPVRLAISSDGRTVYALFQRITGATPSGSDYQGEVVLTRDDTYGGGGFGALGLSGAGTKVATGIVLPASPGTSLGAQRLGSDCDVAINPARPATVYVAYTEAISGTPILHISKSVDSGAHFSVAQTINSASIPALAVASGDTLGMLYAVKNGIDLEIHFQKALSGSFAPADLVDRILAKFPNNNPPWVGDPYIGDYFQLRAVNYDFFGTFCASNDPLVEHFPSGVYFQRYVKIGGISGSTYNELWLSTSGQLVEQNGVPIFTSIDPFIFYDIAPSVRYSLYLIPPSVYEPGDPYSGAARLSWELLPTSQPPIQLYRSSALGPGANWTLAANNTIIQTNGQNLASFFGAQNQQYYRLQQNVASGQFRLFAAAGANGSLNPSGVMTNAGLTSRTFAASPNNSYALGKWYVDGVVVQSNSPSLTLSNIISEHTVVATFVALNDLALTVTEFSGDEGPAETFHTNSYVIDIQNKGLNPLTGVSMTNVLDSTVSFRSASTSQGSVNYLNGVVTASLGSLNPGSMATVNIQCVPFIATNIADIASVGCEQFEPDRANNFATNITVVIDPVIITNQPASVVAPVGGTATFTVGVKGSPPFTYLWFFNGTNLINSANNSTLSLTNLTPSQSGAYSVTVLQVLSPENVEGDNSAPATLLVQ